MKDEMETENQKRSDSVLNPSVLEAFDLLKSPKDDVKTIGGSKIISVLDGKENEKSVNYVLKRLVRSLGANVPEMRSGYFATLVAFLSKFHDVTVSNLLELVRKELHAIGSSKSEVGDLALGKILISGAVFRSGLMLRCSEQEQKDILTLLMSAATKKSYLGTTAYVILLDFVNQLNKEQFSSIIWSNIKQDFKKDIKEHNLDSLYFLIIVSKKFPDQIKLRKLIGVPELFCEDTIHTICEKIMSGIDLNLVSHPLYTEIGKEIANSPHLKLFWTSGIDSQLIKHKRNKELIAINILTTILNNIQENHDVIPELLSKNFFKLFMDWFKGLQTASKIRTKRDDEDDHKLVIKKEKELLNALAKAMKSEKVEAKVRVETLKKLLFFPGDMNFTETTGTNVVKSIISDLDKDGVKKFAKLFKGVLFNTSKKIIKNDVERPWYNNERLKAAEMLSYLVNHDAVKDDTEFKLSYMKILMCFGFFKIGGSENVAISSELSGSIKTSFYRCFSSRFSSADSLVEVLSSLAEFINSNLSKDTLKDKLEKQFPKENMECWELLNTVCQTIEKNESKSKIDKVFLILLYQLGLFLFSEPSQIKMARGSIKELKSCYEHYRKSTKQKKKTSGSDNEEPEWIEVVVEVLLSILSTDSSVLRSIVQCVYRLLWEYLTPSCIMQIVSVLDPENENNPLTEEEDSDMESNDDEEEDDEASEKDKEDEGESDDSDIEVESEDAEDEDDLKNPEQLRLAVQKALGAAAPDSDTESIDADMIDEEEGRKLDEALAEAFKQFRQGKGTKTKKDRKDKKTLSDFRIRVVDLIDIYLEKDPSMDICLNMMAPLMRALEFCIQDNQFKELENRLRKTVKTLAKIKKFSSTDDVTIDTLCEYLKAVVDKGSKSHFMYQALGDIITHFATFAIHCSFKLNTSTAKSRKHKPSPLVELFKHYLKKYFHNRNSSMPIIFFHSVLQTDWVDTYDLVHIVVENVFDMSVRQFCRSEGLELIAGFFRFLKRIKPDTATHLAKLNNLESAFETTLKKAMASDEFTAKKNFVVSLKKIINLMKSFHETCHIDSKLNFNELLETVGSFKGIVKNAVNGEQQETKENGITTESKGKKKKNKKRKAKETDASEERPKNKKKKDVVTDE